MTAMLARCFSILIKALKVLKIREAYRYEGSDESPSNLRTGYASSHKSRDDGIITWLCQDGEKYVNENLKFS
jgi:hypothetical protein